MAMVDIDHVLIMDSEAQAKLDLETRKPTTYALREHPNKFLLLKRKSGQCVQVHTLCKSKTTTENTPIRVGILGFSRKDGIQKEEMTSHSA